MKKRLLATLLAASVALSLAAGCKGYRYSDRGTARYLHSQCDYEIHEKALNRLYTDFMIEP